MTPPPPPPAPSTSPAPPPTPPLFLMNIKGVFYSRKFLRADNACFSDLAFLSAIATACGTDIASPEDPANASATAVAIAVAAHNFVDWDIAVPAAIDHATDNACVSDPATDNDF